MKTHKYQQCFVSSLSCKFSFTEWVTKTRKRRISRQLIVLFVPQVYTPNTLKKYNRNHGLDGDYV